MTSVSRITFHVNEQSSSLDIRLPNSYETTYTNFESHSWVCGSAPVELCHCTLDSLEAAGDVYLTNCSIRTVQAAGNVFCRDCPQLGQVKGEGDVCTLGCRDVQRIQGTNLFIDLSGNLTADLKSQTGHVYFLGQGQFRYKWLGEEGPTSATFIPMSKVTVNDKTPISIDERSLSIDLPSLLESSTDTSCLEEPPAETSCLEERFQGVFESDIPYDDGLQLDEKYCEQFRHTPSSDSSNLD